MIERVQANKSVCAAAIRRSPVSTVLSTSKCKPWQQPNLGSSYLESVFQAAAAKLKVELTVPGLVQTIILSRIRWSHRSSLPRGRKHPFCSPPQASSASICARHIKEATSQLLKHYPPETPVAICFRLGWPDESGSTCISWTNGNCHWQSDSHNLY